MHTYMHHSFLPLLQSMINQTQSAGGDASTEKKEQKIGLPAVAKKLKELELSLIQCQEQYKIPDVNLFSLVHPLIKAAAEQVRSGGAKMDLDELGLSAKLKTTPS